MLSYKAYEARYGKLSQGDAVKAGNIIQVQFPQLTPVRSEEDREVAMAYQGPCCLCGKTYSLRVFKDSTPEEHDFFQDMMECNVCEKCLEHPVFEL